MKVWSDQRGAVSGGSRISNNRREKTGSGRGSFEIFMCVTRGVGENTAAGWKVAVF